MVSSLRSSQPESIEVYLGSLADILPLYKYKVEHGDTYYISRTGSDSNDSSYSRPWVTIYRALDTLGPGEMVYFRGGDCYTPFTVTKSGSPGNPIVISAYPDERVRILQPTNWQQNNYNAATVCLSRAEHVWIHGLGTRAAGAVRRSRSRPLRPELHHPCQRSRGGRLYHQ
ncbi:MAG: hypothetical protein IT210_10495 [Armatimonadetes bacterium]|nr:hypothetical protein [Armatimonadota bacterium]